MPHLARGMTREEYPEVAGWLATLIRNPVDPTIARRYTTNEVHCELCYQNATPGNPVWQLLGNVHAISGLICESCVNGPPIPCVSCGLHAFGSASRPDRQPRMVYPLCYTCYNINGRCDTCRRDYVRAPDDLECRSCSGAATVPALICPHCFTKNPGRSLSCKHCTGDLFDDDLTFTRVPINRPVGVELEMVSTRMSDTAYAPFGKLAPDGSIRVEGEHYYPGPPDPAALALGRLSTYELRMDPEVGDRFAKNISLVTNHLMKHYSAYTNASCGTHVHVYAGDLSSAQLDNVAAWWRAHEFMFFRLVPSYRQKNRFAIRVGLEKRESWRANRYYALNLSALTKHKTLEFRLHHGTLDADRIINWTNMVLHFVERLKDVPITDDQAVALARGPKRGLLTRFINDTALPAETTRYIVDTAKLYWTRRCGLLTGGDANDPVGKILTPDRGATQCAA